MKRKKDDIIDLAIQVRKAYDGDLQQAVSQFIGEISREMKCLEQDARIFHELKLKKQVNATTK